MADQYGNFSLFSKKNIARPTGYQYPVGLDSFTSGGVAVAKAAFQLQTQPQIQLAELKQLMVLLLFTLLIVQPLLFLNLMGLLIFL